MIVWQALAAMGVSILFVLCALAVLGLADLLRSSIVNAREYQDDPNLADRFRSDAFFDVLFMLVFAAAAYGSARWALAIVFGGPWE